MNGFEHENLDVYRVSIEFLVLADEVASALPKGRAHLVDQLRRASTSISLSIAEGAGEFSKADKARFYRIARRSSTECSAILDVCRVLQLTDEQKKVENCSFVSLPCSRRWYFGSRRRGLRRAQKPLRCREGQHHTRRNSTAMHPSLQNPRKFWA